MNDALLALAENEEGLYSDELLEALVETIKEADWPKLADPSHMLSAICSVTSEITDCWLEDCEEIFEDEDAIEVITSAIVNLTSNDPDQLWVSMANCVEQHDEIGSVIFLFAIEQTEHDFSSDFRELLSSKTSVPISDNVSPFLVDAINSEANLNRVEILNDLIDPRADCKIQLENTEDYASTYNCLLSRICQNQQITSIAPLVAYLMEEEAMARTLDVFYDELEGAFMELNDEVDVEAVIVQFNDTNAAKNWFDYLLCGKNSAS